MTNAIRAILKTSHVRRWGVGNVPPGTPLRLPQEGEGTPGESPPAPLQEKGGRLARARGDRVDQSPRSWTGVLAQSPRSRTGVLARVHGRERGIPGRRATFCSLPTRDYTAQSLGNS